VRRRQGIQSPRIPKYVSVLQHDAFLAAIREHTGLATEDEHNLRRYLASNEYPVHEPINAYLRGIGNFEDPSGTDNKFRLQRLPGRDDHNGIAGYFGRVNEATHHLYEFLPSPGVAAHRVVADIQYTVNQVPQVWNLPEELLPPEDEVRIIRIK
jgi:hypothetical protein